MPLVLPFLRLLLLFVNVYETFKTLRPPRGSSRSSQLSVRAVSQRKRDMKGCMTVWLLWCCFTMFERNCDPVLGFVVPFYNEMKSTVYLFQLIARAKGAEPVYLHVIRPIIKPYAATLDVTLDTAAVFGDFVMLIVSLPVQAVRDWWYPEGRTQTEQACTEPIAASAPAPRVESRIPSGSKSTIPTRVPSGNGSASAQAKPVAGGVGTRVRRAGTIANSNTNTARTSNGPAARPAPVVAPSLSSKSSNGSAKATQKKYEVWHPPQQSKESRNAVNGSSAGRCNVSDPVTGQRVTSNPPTPPDLIPNTNQMTSSASAGQDDWRNYPPFPSAYPTTPYKNSEATASTTNSDGTTITAVSERVVTDGNGVVIAEVEEWRLYPPFPSAYPTTPQRSLQEGNNPSAPVPPVIETNMSKVHPARVQVTRPQASKQHARMSSSQSLPTRRGRGGISTTSSRTSTLTRRSGRVGVDSDTNSVEQDFGQPRESHEDEGSGSRGEGCDTRGVKRQRGLRDVGNVEQGGDVDDGELDEDAEGSDEEMDFGLTDGDETMVASVSSLDEMPAAKRPATSEFGVKNDKTVKSRTTGQIRTTNSTTTRGRGHGGASTIGVTVGAGIARKTSRSISQSTVHSAISATDELYTPISREPSAQSFATASSMSSNSGSSSFSEGPGTTGTKRPRAQMLHENRNRFRSKVGFGNSGASGSESTSTLAENESGLDEVETLGAVAVPNVPQVKKRKVGVIPGAGVAPRRVRGDMPPPTQIPEGRAKKPF